MGNIQCLGKNLFGKIWRSKNLLYKVCVSSIGYLVLVQ